MEMLELKISIKIDFNSCIARFKGRKGSVNMETG